MYAKLGYVSATDEDINDKTKLIFKIVDKSKYSIIPNFIHVCNTEHFHFTTWWFDDIKYVCAIFLFNVKSKMLKFKLNGNYGSIHSSSQNLFWCEVCFTIRYNS